MYGHTSHQESGEVCFDGAIWDLPGTHRIESSRGTWLGMPYDLIYLREEEVEQVIRGLMASLFLLISYTSCESVSWAPVHHFIMS